MTWVEGGCMRFQSAKIFLNYRRSVTSGHTASTIAERLRLHFGTDSVFLDSHSIRAGQAFVSELERAISKCNVFLALIGPNWVNVRGQRGNQRLDDPEDFVAMEI